MIPLTAELTQKIRELIIKKQNLNRMNPPGGSESPRSWSRWTGSGQQDLFIDQLVDQRLVTGQNRQPGSVSSSSSWFIFILEKVSSKFKHLVKTEQKRFNLHKKWIKVLPLLV